MEGKLEFWSTLKDFSNNIVYKSLHTVVLGTFPHKKKQLKKGMGRLISLIAFYHTYVYQNIML
jgi:hypothetical protein